MPLSLYVVTTICEPFMSQLITACVRKSQALLSLDLADHSESDDKLQVDMLVGSDYYWALVTGSICRIEGEPTAVHTKLAWVQSGPTSVISSPKHSVNLTTTHVLIVETQTRDNILNEELKSFGELESLGIQEEEKLSMINCQVVLHSTMGGIKFRKRTGTT